MPGVVLSVRDQRAVLIAVAPGGNEMVVSLGGRRVAECRSGAVALCTVTNGQVRAIYAQRVGTEIKRKRAMKSRVWGPTVRRSAHLADMFVLVALEASPSSSRTRDTTPLSKGPW